MKPYEIIMSFRCIIHEGAGRPGLNLAFLTASGSRQKLCLISLVATSSEGGGQQRKLVSLRAPQSLLNRSQTFLRVTQVKIVSLHQCSSFWYYATDFAMDVQSYTL